MATLPAMDRRSGYQIILRKLVIMKLLQRMMLLVLLALTGSYGAQARKQADTLRIQTSIYCDHCRQCESCGPRLEKAIFRLGGIRKVKIEAGSNVIQVVYRPGKVSADDIRRAIAMQGFNADHIQADPAAYQKLDGCCKKR